MFFYFCIFIFNFVSFQKSVCLYMYEKTELSNILPGTRHHGSFLVVKTSTTIYECALQCENKLYCKSVFFKNDTTQCFIYSDDFGIGLTDSVSSSETRCYAVGLKNSSGANLNSGVNNSAVTPKPLSVTSTTLYHSSTAAINSEDETTIPPPLDTTMAPDAPTYRSTKSDVSSPVPLTTISVATTTDSVCPSVAAPNNDECTNQGNIRSGPYCYRRSLSEVKFYAAKSECVAISGTLLVIDSDEEMACVKDFTLPGTYYKIGIEYIDSKWKHTETGEEVTYLPWSPGSRSPQDETAVLTNYQYLGWSKSLVNYYICEFDQYFVGNPTTNGQVVTNYVETTNIMSTEITTLEAHLTTEATCPTVSVPDDDCITDGYSRIGPYCYKRYLAEVTFSDALTECNSILGTVLVVNSDEEMACVKDFTVSGTYYKIGLERDGSKWKTVADGNVVSYLPWKSGEPSAQDCVVMTAYKYLAWSCTLRNYYICEFEQYFIGNPVTSGQVVTNNVDTTNVMSTEITTLEAHLTTEATCPTVSVPDDDCITYGYSRVGPYCYKRFLSEVTFSNALTECTVISGTVLVVNSDEEMACVKDFTVSGTYYKIGLERDVSQWKTVADGNVVTYLPWKSGEPSAQDCVVMTAYKYRAWSCTLRNYFICEFSQYQA